MKKVKFMFIALAILLSIGGAFATRSRIDCRFATTVLSMVGWGLCSGRCNEGNDYFCAQGPGICTFVQSGSNYVACQTGVYIRLILLRSRPSSIVSYLGF